MYQQRLKYLLERHLDNTITEVELEELFDLLDKVDQTAQEHLLQDFFNRQESPKYQLAEDRRMLLYQKLKDTLVDNIENSYGRRTFLQKNLSWAKYVAAALVLVMLTTLYVVRNRKDLGLASTSMLLDTLQKNTHDIYLESERAPRLRLANGEVRSLEKDSESQLAELGVHIHNEADGETVYRVQDIGDFASASTQEYLVFSTPKGQTSKIVLIDGTIIWLNSGSSLSYPTVFSNRDRRVKLTGEAYFEVAHNNKKPFYVETDAGAAIKVLGTQFNLKAYKEEKTVTTTLVEGAVQFNMNSQITLLEPQDQVVVDLNVGRIHKKKVNVTDYTSWKEGYFSFNQQSVAQILETVQRWYNIEEITYEYLSEEKFSGTFKRTKSLKSLLTRLEKISNTKFNIKERRIVVTK